VSDDCRDCHREGLCVRHDREREAELARLRAEVAWLRSDLAARESALGAKHTQAEEWYAELWRLRNAADALREAVRRETRATGECVLCGRVVTRDGVSVPGHGLGSPCEAHVFDLARRGEP
jgi:hypothetical protein